ncbi:MAG: hypothetical protein JNN30_22265 [Rhodanobacteraceae bacterium]|nr:hypothetical protein [Rhodanobacteraceae bacterium]
MTTTTRLLLVAALMAGLGLYGALRKPYGTRLPLDVDDLSEIQPQLDRLSESERELVLGYLKRSNGDVLPAALADPDEPLTARTFGEAIELQQAFLHTQAERNAVAAQRRAERDRGFAPLREALELRLVRRELLTPQQVTGIGSAKPVVDRSDSGQTLVVTYRLVNNSGREIASAKGSVEVFDLQDQRRTECWIEQRDRIEPFARIDVRCGNAMRRAGEAERALVELPADQLRLVWEPAEIVFADGSRLAGPR